MSDSNLFAALRAAFPANLDGAAVEAVSPHGEPLNYSWRDLDRISARMANLLASLQLPPGAAHPGRPQLTPSTFGDRDDAANRP